MFVLLFLLIPVLSIISAKPTHLLVHEIGDDTWSSNDEDFLNAEVVLENLIEEINRDKPDLPVEDFPEQLPEINHEVMNFIEDYHRTFSNNIRGGSNFRPGR